MDTTPEPTIVEPVAVKPTPTNPAEDPLPTEDFPNGVPTASDVAPAPPVSEDPADDPLLVNNSVRALIGKEIARLYALAAQSGLLNRLHLKGSHLSDEAK